MHPKWCPIPYIVHYIGNRVLFRTQSLLVQVVKYMLICHVDSWDLHCKTLLIIVNI